MIISDEELDHANLLRSRAEEILRGKLVELNDMPIEDIQFLMHELQVHQAELSIQNDELRRIQLDLETARDLYSDLYNFAPVGYCTLDRKGLILEANQTLAALLVVERKRLIKKKLSDFISREDQDRYYLHRQQTFEDQQSHVIDLQMVIHTGETLFVQLESAIDHQDKSRIRVIISDITERKGVERELERYSQDLERANEAMRDFSSIAAHDLQEPLRKVKAFGELLERQFGEKLGDDGKNYIARMTSAAARMSIMLQGLLVYSRVTSQSMPFVDVDLRKTVEEVLTDLDARVMETGGKVDLGELPVIQADPMQMRQLIQNLIGNALKYHHPDVAPLVMVSSRRIEENRIEICVTDNGIGIDMQYKDHIFKPFVRLNGRSIYEGSGMGLAICKKIVERHSGTISVSSVLGQGSTFTVTLPI